MAVTKGDYMRPARSLVSGSIPSFSLPETTGMTFGVGEPITLTSGLVAAIATTDSAIKTAASIYGVTCTTGKALTSAVTYDSTGVTQIIPAVGWMVWEVAVQHTTTASSVIKNAHLGVGYSLYRSASNKIWYLNVASTSPVDAYVVGFRDATGTQNGHVYVVLGTAARHAAWTV